MKKTKRREDSALVIPLEKEQPGAYFGFEGKEASIMVGGRNIAELQQVLTTVYCFSEVGKLLGSFNRQALEEGRKILTPDNPDGVS